MILNLVLCSAVVSGALLCVKAFETICKILQKANHCTAELNHVTDGLSTTKSALLPNDVYLNKNQYLLLIQ